MDWTLFHHVNQFAIRTSWAHGPFRVYADYGMVLFALLLALGAIVAVRAEDAKALARCVWAGIAALVVLAINQPIANAVNRARPYTTHPHVLTLVDRGSDPSFMSDHSVVAGAVAVGLLFAVRKIGYVAIVAALVMFFARVYVGAHYPGDVVAGAALGAIVAAAGIPLADRYLTPIAQRVLDTSVGQRLPEGHRTARPKGGRR